MALACLASAGCSLLDTLWGKQLRPDYCRAHLDDLDCRGAFPDAAADPTCTTSATCVAPAAVCDVAGTMTCVQCVAPGETSACLATTPVCGEDHACRGCRAHADCPQSGACLPDGSCATEVAVAYVDPAGTDNTSCTKLMPCTQVTKALGTGRPYVKLHGTTDEAVSIDSQTVTLLAEPGAKLTRTSNGLLLEIRGSAQVAIYDLEVTGASGGTGIGISLPAGNTATLALRRVKLTNNAGGGLSASGGTLTLTQSTVSGNAGGGISISGAQFDITNSFIVQNGGPLSGIGGLDISQILAAGTHRLELNTITGNGGNLSINSGVNCSTVVVPVVFKSNILYGNTVSGGGRQLGGGAMCSASYSDVGPDPAPGATNINADPMFVNASQNNFHLLATSPAKDAADPAATLAQDFDGDARPQGPRRDMGADEVKP